MEARGNFGNAMEATASAGHSYEPPGKGSDKGFQQESEGKGKCGEFIKNWAESIAPILGERWSMWWDQLCPVGMQQRCTYSG